MEELKVASENIQFIVIRLGEETFGIDIRFVDNIIVMPGITRVPKAAPFIVGVINLRGEVIPVMSLRRKMEMPTVDYTKATRVIIVKLEQQGTVGLIVDEVREVLTLSTDDIEKTTYGKDDKQAFLMGVGKFGDNLISLLNLDTVVSDN